MHYMSRRGHEHIHVTTITRFVPVCIRVVLTMHVAKTMWSFLDNFFFCFVSHGCLNKKDFPSYTHCIDLCTIYVDLYTSAAADSSDPSEDNEQMGLDPIADDPPAEDNNEEDEEEPVEKPTAAEVVQAGVAWGQLDETVPIDRRKLDDTEERVIQQFAQDGCKCDFGPNQSPCCTTITVDHFRSV